jgi:superfamily II DNA or RNA helicase
MTGEGPRPPPPPARPPVASLRGILDEFFDEGAIARGQAYAQAGQVAALAFADGVLTAQVFGSAPRPYRVRIELPGFSEDGDGIHVEDVISDCSCPVVNDCKHAVAALTAFARARGRDLWSRHQPARPAAAPSPPATAAALGADGILTQAWHDGDHEGLAWVGQLSAEASRHRRPAGDEVRTVFVLMPTAQGALGIEVAVQRRLKSGRWGIGKRHRDLRALAQGGGGLPAPVLALLRELVSHMPTWGNALGPETPDAVLRRLLASGLAVLDRPDGPPAAVLPPLPVQPCWRTEHERWRLVLVDDRDVQVEPVLVMPPWHRAGDGFGPLACAVPGEVMGRILAMPWLAAPAARLAALALAELAPGIPPFPGPALAEPQALLRVARLPVEFTAQGGRHRVEVEVAVACFRYGDDEVGEAGAALLRRRDGSALVRQPGIERRRRLELDRFGLGMWPPPGVESATPRLPPGLIPRMPVAEVLRGGPGPVAIGPAVLAGLRGSGWTVVGVDAAAVSIIDLGQVTARVEERDDGDWFELHLGMDLGDRRLDLVPLLTPLLRGGRAAWETLPRAAGDPPAVLVASGPDTVVRVPLALIESLHDHLVELFSADPGPAGGWRLEPSRADLVEALDRLSPRWIGDTRLRSLADRLRSCLEPPEVPLPAGLRAELRPYQRQGLAWLQRLAALGVGGILADDMGLGKTVQAIAHLLAERVSGRADRPSLVVCPASMVGVWSGELARFAPDLAVAVAHGANRREVAELGGAAVVVTSHATLARDSEAFAAIPWHVVVCDEAQAAKNPATSLALALRRLEARQRLALTGTPVENHLGELHTLLSWAVPGVLGPAAGFSRTFRMPIEEAGDDARRQLLRRRVAPFLLRRTKAAVASDLPARSEIDLPVVLGPRQRQLYEAIRLAMDRRVRDAVAERGLARSGLEVLEALLRLRQSCCDPRLLPGTLAQGCSESAKLEALAELLGTLIDEGRRVLVFSQFTALLDLVESEVLTPLRTEWLRLDGASRDRAALVERFQGGTTPVFLLSLKAGGTGLTLTAADTVVLLDPWWNPAVERQAADRAHRIGQLRPVTIYRLVVAGSVEERIRQLQLRKAAIAEALMDESGQALGRLTIADIEALMAPVE